MAKNNKFLIQIYALVHLFAEPIHISKTLSVNLLQQLKHWWFFNRMH